MRLRLALSLIVLCTLASLRVEISELTRACAVLEDFTGKISDVLNFTVGHTAARSVCALTLVDVYILRMTTTLHGISIYVHVHTSIYMSESFTCHDLYGA